MSKYSLKTDLYVLPTPAGAFYYCSSSEMNSAKILLQNLFQNQASPQLTLENLEKWTDMANDDALQLLHHLQSQALVQGFPQSISSPQGSPENILPDLLPSFSTTGKVILADGHGFYLSLSGFPYETAEELAALSADLISMHKRHNGLLNNNLGHKESAWALVDATGNSQIGFWPLFVGEKTFTLIINDIPRFNHPSFVQLIWALAIRYGQ